MSRLLAASVAVIFLLAGLIALAGASTVAQPGAAAVLQDPVLPVLLAESAVPATIAAALALILGLAAATAIRHAGARLRLVIFGIAICQLILPAPLLTGWPSPAAQPNWDIGGLPYAVIRGATLVLLITAPSVAAITSGLRQAARSAGATPLLAWRHVVLAQIWRPACLGWLAAALAALAQTPAIGILAAHLDLWAIWLFLTSLLLIACSVLALGAPRRARRRRAEPDGHAYLQ